MAEFPVVAIGTSAGSLEHTVFGTVPGESGLGLVIAAHLDLTRKSRELLGRCTKMPVIEIPTRPALTACHRAHGRHRQHRSDPGIREDV
jgi:hypothetical protein